MRPFVYTFKQSGLAEGVVSRRQLPVNDYIARFLAESARYLFMPAAELRLFKKDSRDPS